jgi:ribosomal protein S18 acetylase RimI-like enzyme
MTEILLENMKKFAEVKVIELDVLSANAAAIKLYDHFGFKRAGTFPKAYILRSGNELDNISMHIDL